MRGYRKTLRDFETTEQISKMCILLTELIECYLQFGLSLSKMISCVLYYKCNSITIRSTLIYSYFLSTYFCYVIKNVLICFGALGNCCVKTD